MKIVQKMQNKLEYIRTYGLKSYLQCKRLEKENVFSLHGELRLYPDTVCDLDKSAMIVLNAPLALNAHKLKNSKAAGNLRMEESSKLITDGKFSFYYQHDIQLFKGSTLTLGGVRQFWLSNPLP